MKYNDTHQGLMICSIESLAGSDGLMFCRRFPFCICYDVLCFPNFSFVFMSTNITLVYFCLCKFMIFDCISIQLNSLKFYAYAMSIN